MSPPGPEGITLRPLCQKNLKNPVDNENVASTYKQGILNTKFSFFRERKPYALGNAERSVTLVGHLIKSSWEFRISCCAEQEAV